MEAGGDSQVHNTIQHRMEAGRHERPLFVLFGASMTEYSFQPGGWGASLTDLYSRKADILLRGYRGWNTRRALTVLNEFFPKEHPSQPALVVVFFGANDAFFPMPSGRGPHVPLQEFKENIRSIASHLKGLSETTRVVLVTPPPIYEDGRKENARLKWGEKAAKFVDRTNERTKEYAHACIEVSKELNVGTLDLWTAIQKNENWETRCLSDGLHLTAEGNQVLFNELAKVLDAAEWLPSLRSTSMPEDYLEPSDSAPLSFEFSDDKD